MGERIGMGTGAGGGHVKEEPGSEGQKSEFKFEC